MAKIALMGDVSAPQGCPLWPTRRAGTPHYRPGGPRVAVEPSSGPHSSSGPLKWLHRLPRLALGRGRRIHRRIRIVSQGHRGSYPPSHRYSPPIHTCRPRVPGRFRFGTGDDDDWAVVTLHRRLPGDWHTECLYHRSHRRAESLGMWSRQRHPDPPPIDRPVPSNVVVVAPFPLHSQLYSSIEGPWKGYRRAGICIEALIVAFDHLSLVRRPHYATKVKNSRFTYSKCKQIWPLLGCQSQLFCVHFYLAIFALTWLLQYPE